MSKVRAGIFAFLLLAAHVATALPAAAGSANATDGNLIPNPSVEAASGDTPANWTPITWGTNKTTFSYLKTGHTGKRSVEVQTTQFSSGASEWYYGDLPVTAGKTYRYTNWYKSSVDTKVYAELVMQDGSLQYAQLGVALANTNWSAFSTAITVTPGIETVSIYQVLTKAGYVISDDYALTEYTPPPFERAIVSVSFDDGWQNQYTNALPLLQKYDIKATFNIIAGELANVPDYMSSAQVKDLYTSGYEIASHSQTHPDLTTLTPAKLTSEMSHSQAMLQKLISAPVTDFAYPYGSYSANTLTVGKRYYQSQRSVNAGFNTKDYIDPTQLKVYEVDSDVSVTQVEGWVDAAVAQKGWLILLYHEIADTPTGPTDAQYTTRPADLETEMAYLKNNGVAMETVHQALAEVSSQKG